MVLGLFLVVLAGAPVVVHLTESANLPADHPGEIMLSILRGIESSTGKQAVIDDLADCREETECLDEIGAQYSTTEVVLVRLVGAVRTGRALVSLGAPDKGAVRRVDLEYPLDRTAEWDPIFKGLAAILFPAQLRAPDTVVIEQPPRAAAEPSIVGPVLSWTAIGSGVAFGIAATALRVSSNSIRNDVDGRTLDDPMRDDLISSSSAQGLASNLLFGAAAVAIASGAVYLLTR